MIYPYLTAVLPTLTPGHAPGMTPEEFDELARDNMSETAFARLSAGELPGQRAMRRFTDYLAFRSARIRAERLDLACAFPEPEEFAGEIDFALSSLAAAAPAERETLTDALLWRKLDDLETGHEMDLEHLGIYRMRLKMLQKYTGRDETRARENFERALEKLSADYLA
ncbi:MAG: hypothetical protein MR051_01430 [Lentisphaeria bacterium]|nr:hypothetical protein [Lentisphaeria bacterium]